MAHGRTIFGVALLFAFAGSASAQPLPGVSYNGPATPGGPPAFMPGFPMPMPTAGPQPGPTLPYTATLSGEEAPPIRELPNGGLTDLIPEPAHGGHHGSHGCPTCGEHEISGFMRPFYPEQRGWYTTGEFLLVRPRYSDFDYVIRGQDPGLATVGPIDSIKYGVGTGFRVELGYRFGENGKWELGGAYTYVTGNESGGSNSSAFANGGTLFPTLTRPGLTDRALAAVATADLDYQLYDIIVGRRVLFDEHFAMRFIGGLRFADLRQNSNVLYDGLDARQDNVLTRSRFQGVGPIIGGEAVIVGWKGFHLYSRAYGGLISGRSTNRLLETNDAGATTYVNTTYDVRKIVPMANLAVGVGWQYRTISIRAGYDVTYWQGVFERPRFVDDVSQGKVITRPGNLTLEGLVLQLGLNF